MISQIQNETETRKMRIWPKRNTIPRSHHQSQRYQNIT